MSAAARPPARAGGAGGAASNIFQFKLVLLGAHIFLFCRFLLLFILTADRSGDSAVGKSSLVLRFVKGQFHEYQESTIGGTFLFRSFFRPKGRC